MTNTTEFQPTAEQLSRAYVLGREYATRQIAAGQLEPTESPLSGEWADGPLVQDIFEEVTGRSTSDILTDDEGQAIDTIGDSWEEGYSARFEVLWCGHVATVATFGTGYAIEPGTGKRICYDCADDRARAEVANPEVASIGAYLASDGKHVTTWSGGQLLTIVQTGKSRAGFYGSEIYYLQAVAPDGSRWYGKNGGPGMFVSMKRAKR